MYSIHNSFSSQHNAVVKRTIDKFSLQMLPAARMLNHTIARMERGNLHSNFALKTTIIQGEQSLGLISIKHQAFRC